MLVRYAHNVVPVPSSERAALISTWPCYPTVIVASGPSLSVAQCEYILAKRLLDKCRVIVVNNCYRRVPNADVLYAADHRWWKCHTPERAVDGEPGIAAICPRMIRYSAEPRAREDFGAAYVPLQGGRGIAPNGVDWIHRGSGGGFQATGLAIKFGARKIIWVGFDAQRGQNGESHFHGDHPRKHLPNPQPFETWREEYDALAKPAAERGIDLVQCSIETSTRFVRRSTLEEEL